MNTTFADTILNIAITGPLVRIDLGTVTPVPGQTGAQALRATPTQQLVMPLDGFIRAFGMQESEIKKLVADGVVVSQSAAQEPSAAVPDLTAE